MHDHLLRHYGPPSSALKAHCCDAAMGIGSLYVCAPVVARTQPTADTWYGTPKHENSATAYLHQFLNLSMGRNMDTQLPERDSLDALTAISEKRAVPPEAPNQQQTNQQQQLQCRHIDTSL